MLVLTAVGIASILDPGLAGPLNRSARPVGDPLRVRVGLNNNGWAFAGLTANTDFYNGDVGVAMVIGRYASIVLVARAGRAPLAASSTCPCRPGIFPTTSPMFVGLLIGVIRSWRALTYFPALSLGPLAGGARR